MTFETLETKEKREIESPPDTVLYLISDIHGLSDGQLDILLSKLETAVHRDQESVPSTRPDQHNTILMGDLLSSAEYDRLIAEFKAAGGDRSKLNLSPEEEKIFDEGFAQRGWRAGIYLKAKLHGKDALIEFQQEALIKKQAVARRLASLPNPAVFVGNADVNAVYGSVGDAYQKEGLEFNEEPKLIDLGERAILIWPSAKDPKSLTLEQKTEFDKRMNEIAAGFVPALATKKEVLIVAHEQPFFGSRHFKEKARVQGFQPYGAPFRGTNPARAQILRLCASLPEGVKLGIAFGHLHSPEEAISAGTGFKLEDRGSGGLGVIKIAVKPFDGERKTQKY